MGTISRCASAVFRHSRQCSFSEVTLLDDDTPVAIGPLFHSDIQYRQVDEFICLILSTSPLSVEIPFSGHIVYVRAARLHIDHIWKCIINRCRENTGRYRKIYRSKKY
jgi:hypothetical protein